MKFKNIIIIFLFAFLTSCSYSHENEDAAIFYNYKKYDKYEFGGIADFIKYKKIYYDANSEEKFRNSDLYTCIDQTNIDEVKNYFNYATNLINNKKKYDFEDSIVTFGDYFYLYTMEGKEINGSKRKYGKYDLYTIYFYDIESHTLFYLHNNS